MYIGQSPTIGNFQVCDAISTVNGQATYNLTVNSVAVTPETANHVLCSVNGILQKPGSSFTIVNSTIVFSANLVTGDVVDFVHILGSVLDLGVPSDDTVTAAKLNNDIISGQTALATAPDDTDEFLVSDAGTIQRIDYSLIKSNPTHVLLTTTTISSNTASVSFTSGIDSTYKDYRITISGMRADTDDKHIKLTYSTDGGSSYLSANYVFAGLSRDAGGTNLNPANGATSVIELTAERAGNASDESFNAELTLFNPSQSGFHKIIAYNCYYFTAASNQIRHLGSGSNTSSTSPVNAVKIEMETGNIAEGVFKLYGIN